jgi:hypothetical protein
MVLWLQFLGCPWSRQGFGDNPWQDRFLKTLYNHTGHWKGPAGLAKGTCLGLSPNLNAIVATIRLFLGTMCKGDAHGDFERRIADSNHLNSAFPDLGGGILQKLGGGYRCGCDARPHGLVSASHPQCEE